MTTRRNYILTATFLACALVGAQQDKKTKKADADFNSYAYADAIDSYEELVEDGYTSQEILIGLGNANYLNAEYKAAADWYGQLFGLEGASIDPEYMFRYAQTLKSLEKYDESDQWMEKFRSAKADDGRSMRFSNNRDYLETIKEVSGRYDIKNLAINSGASDFAPSFNGKEIVFSTARDTGRVTRSIHEWNNKPFLNLYRSTASEGGEFATTSKLSGIINKKTHESSTAFTNDGTTVYFTRNNSVNGKFSRDEEGLSRLKIYRATLLNGEWTDIIELPFNSDDYSVAHPTLSADEKQLYFASDMPGTIGQSDIFVTTINSDGSFGDPKNLGSRINTEGRETFPFVTKNETLYFASDGHPGLGGLDVFATKIDDLNNLYIVNIGKPVNSVQDDFSFILDEDTKKGFFASNREGGQGGDDIYGFTETKEINLDCNTIIAGVVKDEETMETLGDADVYLLNSKGDLVATTKSSIDGSFSLEGDCREGDYKLVAEQDEFDKGTAVFTVGRYEDNLDVEVTLDKTIKRAEVGTDLIKFLNLSPVYFDLDKAEIRPDAEKTIRKVVEYMILFPDVKIEVSSHTDAKASNSYNNRLSKMRAKETITYLVGQGIDEDRLNGIGLGETQLLNDCNTREKCEDLLHQLNRRSEFIVTE